MVKAVFNEIIVKVEYEERVGSGRIVLADTLVKHHGNFFGVVVSVGPDWSYKEVKIGTKILFNRHEGFLINTAQNEAFYSLKPERCLAVVGEIGGISVV